MPAIISGKVLVTGANGYIAQWVVERLLKQGFTVRGTVRSESKAARLRHLFASYGDKLEVVIVEDITQDGAFDSAVQDVDAILHTASPAILAEDPDEVIVPAVRGTTSVLESARVYGARVQRVVVLSSTAAVATAPTSARPFSEADWNDEVAATVQKLGRAVQQPYLYYCTSKVLAERGAWAFVEKYENELAWDLVVLNPPWVYGAPFDWEEGVNASLQFWLTSVFFTEDKAMLTAVGTAWVDVQQLADVHVLALQKPEAGGQRFIVAIESYVRQEWINAACKIDSSIPPGDITFEEGKAPLPVHFMSDRADQIFGIKRISKEECIRDMLPYFKMKGRWGVQ